MTSPTYDRPWGEVSGAPGPGPAAVEAALAADAAARAELAEEEAAAVAEVGRPDIARTSETRFDILNPRFLS